MGLRCSWEEKGGGGTHPFHSPGFTVVKDDHKQFCPLWVQTRQNKQSSRGLGRGEDPVGQPPPRGWDPHLGAVLGDEKELGEGAVQGGQDAWLRHVLKQAVLHVAEELPQRLQQRKVTEVAVGAGLGVSPETDARGTPAGRPPTSRKVITLPKYSPAANRERGRTQTSKQGSKEAGDPGAQTRKSTARL